MALGAVVLVAVLSGCEGDDGRPCIRSHSELMPISMPGPNGTTSIQWMPYDVCDEYGPAPTP
jgi:hypothetical protein